MHLKKVEDCCGDENCIATFEATKKYGVHA